MEARRGLPNFAHPAMKNLARHVMTLLARDRLGDRLVLRQPSRSEAPFFRQEVRRPEERLQLHHQPARCFVEAGVRRRAQFTRPFGHFHDAQYFGRVDDAFHSLAYRALDPVCRLAGVWEGLAESCSTDGRLVRCPGMTFWLC